MKLHTSIAFLIFPALVYSLEEVCQNTVCRQFSADLLAHSLNTSHHPCDDFYEYICGNYPAEHPLDPQSGSFDHFLGQEKLVERQLGEALLRSTNATSRVIQAVSRLYADCLDVGAIERRGVRPLIDLVERLLGAWPMIGQPEGKAQSSGHQWTDLLVEVIYQTGFNFIFTFKDAQPDEGDAQECSIQEGAILLDPQYAYTPNGHLSNGSTVQRYRHFLHQTAQLLGSRLTGEALHQSIETLITFEQTVEALYRAGSANHSHEAFKGSFADLQIATGNTVDWLGIVNAILERDNATLPRYTPTSRVRARPLGYLKLMGAFLAATPIGVLQNFLANGLLLRAGHYTTAAMRQVIATFTRDDERVFSWQAECTQLGAIWPQVLGRVYVDGHLSAHEQTDARRLVERIQASFRGLLQTNGWLDRATKAAAIGKLDALRGLVGFSGWTLNDTRLDGRYPRVAREEFVSGQFLENIIKFNVGRSRELKTDTDLEIFPLMVNAFNFILKNTIVIPAAILQPPFFNHQLPWSLNYGAIGTIIGHEMTHGFDSLGSQYDASGSLKNWWSNETLDRFHHLTGCFEAQYSSIIDPIVRLRVNGSRTLGENIADNGGVKEAYGAYRAHLKAKKGDALRLPGLAFTSDQLFFVGYANIWCKAIRRDKLIETLLNEEHAPNRYRVNVVLGNTPAFAEAFNCPIGTKMNPKEKCAVW